MFYSKALCEKSIIQELLNNNKAILYLIILLFIYLFIVLCILIFISKELRDVK